MPRGIPNSTLERAEIDEQEAGAETPAFVLPAELKQFMVDMASQVSTLTEQVQKIQTERPRNVPSNHLQQPGAVQNLQVPRAALGTPFIEHLSKQMPQGDSFKLTEAIMQAYPRRLHIGSRVRINPDVHRGHVRTEKVMRTIERKDRDGKPFVDAVEEKELIPISWGEVIAKLPQTRCPSRPVNEYSCPGIMDPGDVCPTCGWAATVARVEFLTREGFWAVKVNFPGISSGAREQMFLDCELLPA